MKPLLQWTKKKRWIMKFLLLRTKDKRVSRMYAKLLTSYDKLLNSYDNLLSIFGTTFTNNRITRITILYLGSIGRIFLDPKG